MGNSFKTATIVLAVALVVAAGFGSFSMAQNNGDLKDAQAQIGSLNGNLSNFEGLVADLNDRIDALNDQLGDLEKEAAAHEIEDEVLANAMASSIARMLPSVVFIECAYEGPDGQVGTGSGSGVVMDTNGFILTNRHVVNGAFAARVITGDRRIYEVEDIWEDDLTDLAVVKITAKNLTAASFGDPAKMKLGDTVIAIGYPLGMSPADGGANASAGIISNFGRFFWIEETPYYDLMEIDAAINPGNSGGALINMKGELIGINSAGNDQAQGINYAINVATAKHVYEDLKEGEIGHHPYLGIMPDDNVEELAGEPNAAVLAGAYVLDIDTAGPAAKAGLKLDDVIVKLNGQTIGSASDLIRLLWRMDVGGKATLVVKRGATELTITIDLPRRPADTSLI